MNFLIYAMFILYSPRLAYGTCVFESDFGFSLNCNFKKSGLFRVRNLGGVKAHFGLGFSLGDELGFAESLGNLEGGRRRAINYKSGLPPLTSMQTDVGVFPSTQQSISETSLPQISDNSIIAIDNFLKDDASSEVTVSEKRTRPKGKQMPLMTDARPLPLGVPVFKPLPKSRPQMMADTISTSASQMAQRRTNAAIDTVNIKMQVNERLVDSYNNINNLQMDHNRTFHTLHQNIVPVFQTMPDSVKPVTSIIKSPSPSTTTKIATSIHPNYLQFEDPKFDLKDITVEELAKAANVSTDTIKHAIYVREQYMKAEHRASLAARLREEFIRTSTTTHATPTFTTNIPAIKSSPLPNKHQNKLYAPTTPVKMMSNNPYKGNYASLDNLVATKVMNAPKEYYPVGYEKNFDDNFKSKVDLPPTSFSCVKQKHFPGLYADTDLGCMVFHVCALTDDGMVHKAFLCPEDTLFDQSIVKCNWWFYVDCASSPSIYDSNIPISKSYQLMKSLTYFSNFNKATSETDENSSNGRSSSASISRSSNEHSIKNRPLFTLESEKSFSDDTGNTFQPILNDDNQQITNTVLTQTLENVLSTDKVHTNTNNSQLSSLNSSTIAVDKKNKDKNGGIEKS